MTDVCIPSETLDLLRALQRHLEPYGIPSWLVGGSVRDLLHGRPIADLDVAVAGDALALARAFADTTGGAWVLLDEETGSARVVWPGATGAAGRPRTLDLVRLRAASIQDDLRGRDFTINALALPIEHLALDGVGAVLDPLGGVEDLRRGIIRACTARSIRDDPLRMLRAARIAAQLDFIIADDLQADVRAHHAEIGKVSAERIRDELLKILALPQAGRWIGFLDEVRLLTAIMPELEPARRCDQPNLHYLPVLGHLIEAIVVADWLIGQLGGESSESGIVPDAVWAIPDLAARLPYADRLLDRFGEIVDGVPRLALFKLAVLLHDVAKPRTKAIKPDGGVSFYDHQTIGAEMAWGIARRLRLSRAACDYERLIVREHMRPGQLNELGPALTMRAVYRFFRATGSSGPEVLLHSLCDHMAMQGPMLRPDGWSYHVGWTAEMLQIFYDEGETIRPEPILRGDDLIRELGLAPGPMIGRILEDVREAQAAGEIQTREEALEWARRHGSGASTGSG